MLNTGFFFIPPTIQYCQIDLQKIKKIIKQMDKHTIKNRRDGPEETIDAAARNDDKKLARILKYKIKAKEKN